MNFSNSSRKKKNTAYTPLKEDDEKGGNEKTKKEGRKRWRKTKKKIVIPKTACIEKSRINGGIRRFNMDLYTRVPIVIRLE